MKSFTIVFVLMATFLQSSAFAAVEPIAREIEQTIKEQQLRHGSKSDDSPTQIVALLATELTQKIPDSRQLMSGLTEYMAQGGEGAPHLVRMLWPSIANPQERALFLADQLGHVESAKIGFVAALVATDLVDKQTEAQHLDARDAIGLGNEVLYSGTAFIPIMQAHGGVNPRLAAIWFSKAPYQAALACLPADDDEKIRQLNRVNDLRLEIEKSQSDDQKEQAWRKLDKELESLLLSGSPALEMFAAGVLKWKRTIGPALKESDPLTNALAKCRSPLIDCVLQGVTNSTLISLPSEKIIFSTAALPQTLAGERSKPEENQPAAVLPSTKPQAIANESKPTAETEPAPSGFPVVPVAIIAAVIVGIVTFIVRRKST